MENVKGIVSAPLKHVPTAEREKDDPEQRLGSVLIVFWVLVNADKQH